MTITPPVIGIQDESQQHAGLLRDRRQRHTLEQVRLQHRQPLLHVEATNTHIRALTKRAC